jgi:hypothetical protein
VPDSSGEYKSYMQRDFEQNSNIGGGPTPAERVCDK